MKYYLFVFLSLFFLSCQDEITLDLPKAENRLVVEGYIEPGFPPYVILTNNQGYFDPIDTDTYNDLFVNLSDLDTIEVFYLDENGNKEDSIFLKQIPEYLQQLIPGFDSLPPIYTDLDYINNSNYTFSKEERTYHLKIKWNNQIITSETYIPKATLLDCLWVEQTERTSDKEYKSDIRAVYSDPPEKQNNILIKSKRIQNYERNRKDTILCETINYPDFPLKLVDAGSDILINGESFETYFPQPNDNGFPTGAYNTAYEKECDNGDILQFQEDVVLVKFCQIDEPSMKFWRGLVRQAGTNGNPFAEPLNLVSNINGALGVWTGYAPVYYKVPIINGTTITDTIRPNIIDIF